MAPSSPDVPEDSFHLGGKVVRSSPPEIFSNKRTHGKTSQATEKYEILYGFVWFSMVLCGFFMVLRWFFVVFYGFVTVRLSKHHNIIDR